jgi:glutamate-ammonia-ligase adenylyltransferase
VFLYDDPHEQAQEVYSRLALRLQSWITTRTSAGVLFDTDLALRPSGNSGLMVSSLEAFERYQERDAWVWEHQALSPGSLQRRRRRGRLRIRSIAGKES